MKELRRVRVIWEKEKELIIQYGYTYFHYEKGKPVTYDKEFLIMKAGTEIELRKIKQEIILCGGKPIISLNHFPDIAKMPHPDNVINIACKELNVSRSDVMIKLPEGDMRKIKAAIVYVTAYICDLKMTTLGEYFNMTGAGAHKAIISARHRINGREGKWKEYLLFVSNLQKKIEFELYKEKS